MNSFK